MPSVAILGGGIAGTAAGVALARAGWDVRVHERAPRLETVGAALSLWPNATAALDRLGLLEAVRRRARPFHTFAVADRLRRPILPARRVEGEAMMVTRADLLAAIAGALPEGALRSGRAVADVDSDGARPAILFDDGAADHADLIVDAGGLRSITGTADTPSYRGYGGVVALSDPMPALEPTGVAAEYWGSHERFGLFELPEGRRYWFFMRTATAEAPPLSHAELLARAAGFVPAIGRTVAATPPDRLIPFAIWARPAPHSLGRGRVIRVGDAAHAMEPNLGQGGCQAIEDAVALGVAASLDPAAMLPAFEAMRLKRVSMIVRRAEEGRLGARGPVTAQWTMRTVLRLLPAGVGDRLARSIQTMPAYGG